MTDLDDRLYICRQLARFAKRDGHADIRRHYTLRALAHRAAIRNAHHSKPCNP